MVLTADPISPTVPLTKNGPISTPITARTSHINGINPLTEEQMKIGNVEGEEAEIDIADAVAIIAHINGVKPIEGYIEV